MELLLMFLVLLRGFPHMILIYVWHGRKTVVTA